MKANLKIVLEIDGRRFELTPEEAAELARKLGELCGVPREQGYPIWPTWPPYWWHGTWTGTGTGTGDLPAPTTKVWITGDTAPSACLIPEIQVLTSAAAEPVTWKGNRILTEDDLSRMDCPYPPEPEL